jgi:hypothetical protein
MIVESVERERSSGLQWFTRDEIVKSAEIGKDVKAYALAALNAGISRQTDDKEPAPASADRRRHGWS